MPTTPIARRGMVTAPHHLAASAGLDVLRDGGTAVEAMVAMAAAIAVVYPHMNALGGDGFWLIARPGEEPVGIDASGASAAAATPALYAGLERIPSRGPMAANTVAGTLSGWDAALALDRETGGGRLPLDRLLADAIGQARHGVAVTESQARLTAEKLGELAEVPGFAETYLVDGRPPAPGAILAQPRLAATLEQIASEGPDGFYRGGLAQRVAADLADAGSPVALADLEAHRARRVTPLALDLPEGRVFNLPPPTQGLASLLILGLYRRLGITEADGVDYVHALVEATKRAFRLRDRVVTDPGRVPEDPQGLLAADRLDALAAEIDPARALPWPEPSAPGDTVWMGAIDGDGRAVSFIQSVYWEFGSGVVLGDTGIAWQNRGSSFALDPAAVNALEPGRKPFHTLNPAMARLADGRTLSYGTMGGDGQPQTQAAIFSRHVLHGRPLAEAVAAPRWLLGRTWGAMSTTLKLESRFDPAVIEGLRARGHDVEVVAPLTDMMGHAGALSLRPDGFIDGASDPRSDGAAMGF
ncbi:MAG: gamma-glutamyltransferase [Alphaproteobacteria bacterium]|jgi:gamma-glutamyltranspeptidase/glutathione hydrolase|nr:gamma-glutamyltransferase [Alphaproteobacteria bacterium]